MGRSRFAKTAVDVIDSVRVTVAVAVENPALEGSSVLGLTMGLVSHT